MDAGFLKSLNPEALCLYVFLCVVADRRGRSWYSDSRLLQLVRLTCVNSARTTLIEAGLVAWDTPVYSVLNVPAMPQAAVKPAPRSNFPEQTTESNGKNLSQQEIENLVAHLR